mgnify:FL=1
MSENIIISWDIQVDYAEGMWLLYRDLTEERKDALLATYQADPEVASVTVIETMIQVAE